MLFSNMLQVKGQSGCVKGTKWGQVGSSRIKWGQLRLSGVKRDKKGSSGARLDQVESSGQYGEKIGIWV